MANTAMIPLPYSTPVANPFPIRWLLPLFLIVFFLFALKRTGPLRSQRPVSVSAFAAVLMLFAVAAMAITGCNGGSMSSPPPPVPNGTPAGAYTLVVTITATQPVGGATLSHTQQLTLNVE